MKKPKRWHLSTEERAKMRGALGKLTRQELEKRYVDQYEQVQRFLRAAKKLGQSITELQLLGF